jgi:hypothetical protein
MTLTTKVKSDRYLMKCFEKSATAGSDAKADSNCGTERLQWNAVPLARH